MLYRGTYSEIDLDVFKENLNQIKLHTNKAVFCVCKANAYSHADYYIAKTAFENGCPYICVSSFDEAYSLRNQNFEGDILIMGYVDPESLEEIIRLQITISVFSYEWLSSIDPSKINMKALKVHLKIDTGMNRIGFKHLDEIQKAVALLKQMDVEMEGIYTHYHSADNKDKSSCVKQSNWFYRILDSIDHSFKWVHTSNSDATLSYQDERSNAVRVGLALYGIKSVESNVKLQPVLSLYSTITHMKKVMKGETIGYGATYTCPTDCFIATLPIGYGDGFLRKNQGRFVCVDTHPYEIVGRICMDQTMIRLDKSYPVGTPVEIIGEHISLIKMANELEMIPYEVLCLLSDRITKVIKQQGNVVAVVNKRIAT